MNIDDYIKFDPFVTCFLCQTTLTDDNNSKEHIFPKWLLKELDLFYETITLMNGQKLQYRSLTIPCCNECNNGVLSELEIEIKTAFSTGIDKVKKMNSNKIASWLGKMYMGLLIYESNMRIDIRDPKSELIHESDTLEMKFINFFIIRSILNEEILIKNVYSIFYFNLENNTDFDFGTDKNSNAIYIIVNNIGIILFIEDGGFIKKYFNITNLKYINRNINHLEFLEIFYRLVYFFSYVKDYIPTYEYAININRKIPLHITNLKSIDYRKNRINNYDSDDLALFLNFHLERHGINSNLIADSTYIFELSESYDKTHYKEK